MGRKIEENETVGSSELRVGISEIRIHNVRGNSLIARHFVRSLSNLVGGLCVTVPIFGI